MSVRKTSVEINEDLLTAAQRVLRAEARREEVEALSTLRGMDLSDEKVMSRAWRRP